MQRMQELCREELEKTQPALTTRDLFFDICGGKDLYGLAKEKGYPDMLVFAHLISDPYQYAQKDFGDNKGIPVCTLLKEPKSEAQEHIWYFDNIRRLEGLI